MKGIESEEMIMNEEIRMESSDTEKFYDLKLSENDNFLEVLKSFLYIEIQILHSSNHFGSKALAECS